jgi:IS1 family transposase
MVDFLQNNPDELRIGGQGVTVEADETYLTAKKAARGRDVRTNPTWLWGAVERGSNRSIIVIVPDRTAQTLAQLIQTYIRPGSTIVTDGFASYPPAIANQLFMQHKVVIHRQNFVNPTDLEAHTQTIDGKWGNYKLDTHKHLRGIHDIPLDHHIKEYNWRERYGDREMILFNFWTQVAQAYPCNS